MEFIADLQGLLAAWQNSSSLLSQIVIAAPVAIWGIAVLWALGLWTLSK